MLAKAFRFHGYNSLRFVYSKGRSSRGQQLTLKYCPNPKRDHYRVAVVVSKKVSKSAVVRNRIRRRVYEMVRLYGPTGNCDMVFIVYDASVAEQPAAELTAQIARIMQRADIVPAVR